MQELRICHEDTQYALRCLPGLPGSPGPYTIFLNRQKMRTVLKVVANFENGKKSVKKNEPWQLAIIEYIIFFYSPN